MGSSQCSEKVFNINSSANVCICLLCVSVFGYFKEDILRTLVTMLTELVLKKCIILTPLGGPYGEEIYLGGIFPTA